MRAPAVAGQFYPYGKEELTKEIERCFSISGKAGKSLDKKKILAAICPHAGYVYSGPTAAFSYKAISEDRKKIDTVVLLGPNHTGAGAGISVYPDDEWETPLGAVKVDEKLAKSISDEREFILDEASHTYEHSIEVQLPFLQYIYGNGFKVVPICIMDQSQEKMILLGEKLSKVLDPKKHLVIASTDFSHYVPYDIAYEKDFKVIGKIGTLDVKGMYKTIQELNVSMCGFGAVAAAITYAKKKGATAAELLKYTTSGDILGNKASVVGYSSILIKELLQE